MWEWDWEWEWEGDWELDWVSEIKNWDREGVLNLHSNQVLWTWVWWRKVTNSDSSSMKTSMV